MYLALVLRSARTFIETVTRDENVSFLETVFIMEKMLYRSARDMDMAQILTLVRQEMDSAHVRGTGKE